MWEPKERRCPLDPVQRLLTVTTLNLHLHGCGERRITLSERNARNVGNGAADQATADDSGAGRRHPVRVLIAKPGLDGHDRGAKVVARALRDAGVEVIYTGLHQTPEMIVDAAIQEDVDAIGLSVLSGAHLTLFKAVVELLRANGAPDIVLFGGGIIPEDDIGQLQALGVAKVFTPGTPTHEIVDWVNTNCS